MTLRSDGRTPEQLRDFTITRGWIEHAEGSVLIQCGKTRVLCVASLTPGVPRWRTDSGEGWVTAEYAMLPRATSTRSQRESVKGKLGGRTQEISRLIGRALRAAVDMRQLGENSIQIDCDVLQADGGTRTTAITGAFIALSDAIDKGQEIGIIDSKIPKEKILINQVCAISVGIIDGEIRLDLPYVEDVVAETDMNVVCTAAGDFIEVQGTAEGAPFSPTELNQMLELAQSGCSKIHAMQREVLAGEIGKTYSFGGK